MSDRLLNGTKEIIEYLRPKLGLSGMCNDYACYSPAWRAIKRLMKNHGLDAIIIKLPNGRPQLNERDFEKWYGRYVERRTKRIGSAASR